MALRGAGGGTTLTAMQVAGFDERYMVQEGIGANFVVFVYEGGEAPDSSWSVDSTLLTGTDLPDILHWLRDHLPGDSCWSLGVVLDPDLPTPRSDMRVAWIVGADLLNADLRRLDPGERRLAQEMLARRHKVDLL